MKYIRLAWPEYQEYMVCNGFEENCVYDVKENTYFIPEDWLEQAEVELKNMSF